MRIFIPTLVLLSLLVLPLPVRVRAQNQTTQTTYPINIVVTNPCNGELVTLTGEGHVVVRFGSDSSGGIHLIDITNTMGPLQGIAVPSGAVYRSNQTVSSTINDNGTTPQFEFTFVMSEELISQGSQPNFIEHTIVHATVNSNGLPTASVTKIKADCSG
jgi:hypothetical protein